MAEESDKSLIREIDEELRQEQAMKFWKAYGNMIIGAALAVIVGVAGYKYWQHADLEARQNAGDQFVAAQRLADANQAGEAVNAFQSLSADAPAGFPLLARMRKASLLSEQGDLAGAVAAYDAIAADNDAPQAYRDLAIVTSSMLGLDLGTDPATLITRLAPLTGDDQAFRHSAKEITALALLQSGDRPKAREILEGLVLDPQTPQGVRARAQELLAVLDQS